MSWAAHEFENYFIQKHAGIKISFLGLAIYGVVVIVERLAMPWEFGAHAPR